MAYDEEQVTVVVRRDDDALSTDTYDTTEELEIGQRDTRTALRIDGKVPEVLYVLRMLGRLNKTLVKHESVKPFTRIPEDGESAAAGVDGEDQTEMPVLEIATSVRYDGSEISTRRRGPPRHRRDVSPTPVTTSRPITAGFDKTEYYVDPEYIEDERRRAAEDLRHPIMYIHSEHLINALQAVISYYPRLGLNDTPLSFDAPYEVLYQHRPELARYRDNQPSSHSPEYAATTADHIDVLLRFLESEDLGASVRQEELRHKLSTPLATFENFWLLLKPGSVIYAKMNDVWGSYVISRAWRDVTNKNDPYHITCWYLESDGVKVARFMTSFVVPRWLGEQAISSQPVVPAEYWMEDLEAQGGRTMREKQIREGRMYWELLKRPTYLEHTGVLVNSAAATPTTAAGATGFMSGRVICDAAGFQKYYGSAPDTFSERHSYPGRGPNVPPKDSLPLFMSRCGCKSCDQSMEPGVESPYVDFEDLDPMHSTPPSDLYYMVCKNTIPAFMLSTRRWGQVQLQNLQSVNTDKDAFKYLVLDDNIKMTVKALIGKFAMATEGQLSPWGNDFVKNKGEGRIFLLHGTPGVGKTCTAECIAELTSRPLISLTSGDLGVEIYQVESALNYFLQLGQRYGALVLLDEADVYLERRRAKDISRNGLVSIFLRALEYYRGVLFLTTNRVQSFDRAFLSRIHVALHYRNLRDEDRERIWLNNFDRLARDSTGLIHVSSAAQEFIWASRDVRALMWNGREIRNAMQTALALAEHDAAEEGADKIIIGEKHLRAVVQMSKDFREYIQDGNDDDSEDEQAPDDLVQY